MSGSRGSDTFQFIIEIAEKDISRMSICVCVHIQRSLERLRSVVFPN